MDEDDYIDFVFNNKTRYISCKNNMKKMSLNLLHNNSNGLVLIDIIKSTLYNNKSQLIHILEELKCHKINPTTK